MSLSIAEARTRHRADASGKRVGRAMARGPQLLALRLGAATLFVLLLAHTADHVARQHRTLPAELSEIGTAGLVAAGVVLALALVRHRWAPVAAAIVGFATATGFAAVHLVPHWSVVSDPYPGLGLDAVSWASMLASLSAGLVLGLVGLWAALSAKPRLGA